MNGISTAGAGPVGVPGGAWSFRTHRALSGAIGLSMLLHAALFAFRAPQGGELAPPGAVAPMSVRLIAAPREQVSAPRFDSPSRPQDASTSEARSPALPAPEPSRLPKPVVVARTAAGAASAPPARVVSAPVEESIGRVAGPSSALLSSGYQTASGLNPPPRPLDDITPEFPEGAGTRGGVVVLRLYINEFGMVDRGEVVRSSPPGVFDAAALAAFVAARFSPGYFAGTPVRSQILYEVEFAPQLRDSPASGRGY